MKWFKHDADAHTDAKLEKVLMRYGSDGYALYWMCLELIAKKVDQNNLTFELEHDAEILGYRLKVDQIRIQEIMNYMIGLGLFEQREMAIYCYKLAKRVDVSMFPPNHRDRVRADLNALLHGENLDASLISHDESLISQERSDQIRSDQIKEKRECDSHESLTLAFSDSEKQELKKWAISEFGKKINFELELQNFIDYALANGKAYKNKISAAKLNIRRQAKWAGIVEQSHTSAPTEKFKIQSEINSLKILLAQQRKSKTTPPVATESTLRKISELEKRLESA